ncbi:MarR family transcriptional regulator [Pseudonocardia sp. RS11V-5]|uniref:MarR family winged helix-turn-helix transcriptional regulator n=1 Tax=Pseudonocardia terrae TaxID=2905831 RepID=UPI001E3ABC2B|nr:MarR family transcriptional regulator [Pseudonocardia terrae]MCE3551500.1 MarR family transcriptional regulator [Pseudonocardia terrae]
MARVPAPDRDLLSRVRDSGRALFGADGDQVFAATALVEAHQLLRSRVDERLEPLGLTWGQVQLMVALRQLRAAPIAQLGRRLARHPTNVKKALDRLEEAGLVSRSRDAHDRRVVTAVLSPRGARALDAALDELSVIGFGLAGWGPEQVRRMRDLMAERLGP